MKPVGPGERIDVLDGLRGFAILGIFMINVRVFSGYAYATGEYNGQLLLTGWDPVFNWIHIVFFSGKFYSLFSLLFGIGFAIQMTRASSAERNFLPFFSRRLFFLLLIGIVHLWAIWFSDILVFYAICGYLLLLFRKFSNPGLWVSFFLLLLLPGLHSWYILSNEEPYTRHLYEWISAKWTTLGLPEASNEYETFRMPDITAVIRDEAWGTVFRFNLIGPVVRAYFIAFDARIFKILAAFVLGLYVGRKILFNSLHRNRKVLTGIAIGGWLVGLSLNIFFMYENISWNDRLATVVLNEFLVYLSYISLTSGYAATFALVCESTARKGMGKVFNAVGRTALTNYILQSVLGVLLFYSAGLGLGEKAGPTLLTISVFAIFLVQVLLSNLWLKHYRYGPLEWLWRVLTYGRYMKNAR